MAGTRRPGPGQGHSASNHCTSPHPEIVAGVPARMRMHGPGVVLLDAACIQPLLDDRCGRMLAYAGVATCTGSVSCLPSRRRSPGGVWRPTPRLVTVTSRNWSMLSWICAQSLPSRLQPQVPQACVPALGFLPTSHSFQVLLQTCLPCPGAAPPAPVTDIRADTQQGWCGSGPLVPFLLGSPGPVSCAH